MVAPPARETSLADRQRLDAICDAFEQQWQAGATPEIEEFVSQLNSPLAIVGLIELVVLDAHYRGSHDTRIGHGSKTLIQGFRPPSQPDDLQQPASRGCSRSTWQEYVARFPQLSSVEVPVEFRRQEHSEYLLGGRLSTVKRYAAGGLGQIILAEDAKLKRKVVVKELQPEYALDSEHRQRFLREAEITGQLEHPGIVPVYGVGNHSDGEPWYVMRWIEGQNLKQAIDACDAWQPNGKPSRQRRMLLQRFVDVCNTVHYAHSKHILHRDIKPSNIVLGDYGETLLVDWGLAKQIGSSDAPGDTASDDRESPRASDLTRVGQVMGTAHYMSPEQANGTHQDVREASDIYSLGATLYHTLTGHPPRPCHALSKVLVEESRESQIPESPNKEREQLVSKPLMAICRKAMSEQPAMRYATAGELAEDIESALADQPILAIRASLTTTARRWLQKHRTVASVGLVIASLMLLGSLTIAAIEKSHSKTLADKNEVLDDLVRQERLARVAAERSEKRAGDALTYMTTAMQSPDPNRVGRDVRVVDVLENAALQMEADFADDPEMYARVSYSLGSTFEGLGLFREAQELLEKSVAAFGEMPEANVRERLRAQKLLGFVYWRLGDSRGQELIDFVAAQCKKRLGEDSPEALQIALTIAIIDLQSGEVAKAVESLEALRPRFEKIFGVGSPDCMSLKNNLANALYAAGRIDEAVAISEGIYALRIERFGPNSLSSIRAGINYATHLLNSENPGGAIREMETLLERARKFLGDKHYETLIIMNQLGDAYLKRNDQLRGIPLIEESLAISMSLYGERHHRTLVAANSLGTVYLAEGDYAAAIRQYEFVFRTSQDVRGLRHPDTLTAGNNLASAYRVNKQLGEAAELFQQILATQIETLGPEHLHSLRSMINLAATLQAADRSDEAMPYAVDAVSIAASEFGEQHSMTQTAQSICGTGYLQLGQYAAAKEVLEACLKTRNAKMSNHWLRFSVQSALGEALAGLHENARAEDLLEEAYQGLIERESTIPPRGQHHVQQARERLVRFYEDNDRHDVADALRP